MGRDWAKVKRQERAVAEERCPACGRIPRMPCYNLNSARMTPLDSPHPERVALVREEKTEAAYDIRCPVDTCRAVAGRPCWKFYSRTTRRRDLPRPHAERVKLAQELKAAGKLEEYNQQEETMQLRVKLGQRLGRESRRTVDDRYGT
jgi:hypothetical protein